MENASKALLMAGGILIGILILTSLVIMWTNISKFQSSGSGPDKETQLAEFNQEFATYTGNSNIKGVDIISLVNKVESYDKDVPDVFRGKVQYEPIKIYVENKNETFDGVLQAGRTYEVTGTSNTADVMKKFISDGSALEAKYGREFLSKLSANKQRIEDRIRDDPEVSNYQDAIEAIFGRKGVGDINSSVLESYKAYTSFKTSKFTASDPKYNKEGQINELRFTFLSK